MPASAASQRPLRTRQRLAGIAVAALFAAAAPAMEIPAGIAAFPLGKGSGERLSGTAGEDWGGSAVVIDADGTALTLAEALPPGWETAESITVVVPGGTRREARVVARGATTTAVLLRITGWPASAAPVPLADSRAIVLGGETWTAGNAGGAVEQDGVAALSRGVVSGLYDIPADAPALRGRLGRALSSYRGPVLEVDAAINDGSQGGALLDSDGRLIGLVSLGQARERRLGTAVPLHLVAADLGLTSMAPPTTAGAADGLIAAARAAADCLTLVRFERPNGLDNPKVVPRPPRTVAEAPLYERERVQRWWDQYHHQQQVFRTDQPSPAIVVDAAAGLLVTSAQNLHGGATHGLVLAPSGAIACEVLAVNQPLDLALLRAVSPLPMPSANFGPRPRAGEEIALVAPLRAGDRQTVTMTRGVVSATGRKLSQHLHSWLQIGARANYGSLGGALVDSAGRVVGMSTLLSPEGSWLINSGVAMALDAPAIERALGQLKAGIGTAEAPTLGLGVSIGESAGGKPRLERVIAGTGAEEAGLRIGDELVRVDGFPATSRAAVARALLKRQAGDRVVVEYVRDGKPGKVEVELREFSGRKP